VESAALLAALRRVRQPFPVLRVTWAARGYSLGAGLYAPAGRLTAAGSVTAVTQPGGWEPIEYGSGIEGASLEAVQTAVGIADKDRTLLTMLETYDPRGSAARIDCAAAGLVAADWEPWFVGVVEDWERDGLYTRLRLKTDDTVLRTPVPSKVLSRTEWGSASDSTVFGTAAPLVMGIHDSFAVTARGMLPAVNIRWDKDLGYWWLASLGNLVEIRRLYFDGVAQEAAGWTTIRGVYGGAAVTIISVQQSALPTDDEGKIIKNFVVSFDAEGPDSDGLAVGTSVTNPVLELRRVLEEYVYRTPPLGAWVGDHPIIDDTSWDAAVNWFQNVNRAESARRWGGDQNPESAAEVIDSFLEAYPFVRIHWTPLGTLAIVIIDPDDVDPDAAAWFQVDKHHEGGLVEYAPGDRREVYTQIRMPYMWSTAESKFVGTLEAHDVAALPEKVVLEVPNEWSQGRYLQE
jgi:hypothetical protein